MISEKTKIKELEKWKRDKIDEETKKQKENEIKKKAEEQKWQQAEKERNNMQELINEWKKKAEDGASMRYSYYIIKFLICTK